MAQTPADAHPPAYGAATLGPGIRSRFVENGNGLTMHTLEAGFEDGPRPLVLLLHGFPELAYSWRKLLSPLAAAGYHVVAPDQRGYGRTTGWDGAYDGELASYAMLNLVRDVLGLVHALGYREVAAVVGHDFGSPVAAWASLIRPDVFRSVALMSAPFGGGPTWPAARDDRGDSAAAPDIHQALASLDRPRKHYQAYYGTRGADANMRDAPQGVHDFLRAYYHHKSADWPANDPHPLEAWRADQLALMPTYYIMDLAEGMAETVAKEMPSPDQVAACTWLTDAELAVYAEEFARNGFQGGLQWYRATADPALASELRLFAGRTIDVPSAFIAGASDWGVYQRPGSFEAMQADACTDLRICERLPGAGHWVQQEQPEATAALVLRLLKGR